MAGPLSGPGVGLQLPQNLYPSELGGAPYDFPSNYQTLAAGDQLPIPRGDWLVSLGSYCVLQFLDPVNNNWTIAATAAWDSGLQYVQSDGFNYRIANLTGCPIGGLVNAYGSGWVQASTTVAVTQAGGPVYTGGAVSTWQAIVGGQLTMFSVTAVGGGYGVQPYCFLPAPPGPSTNSNGVGGIQASGFPVISSGTVAGFTFTNPGAGYPSGATFTVVAQPNPTDPNINSGITLASLAFSVTGSGSITGVLCTNPGAPLATPNNITLTLSGAGTAATVSPIMCQTVISTSIIGSATLTGGAGGVLLTSVGGYPQAAGPATPITGTITNAPVYLVAGGFTTAGGGGGYGLLARPRALQALLGTSSTIVAGANPAIIYDSGLFFGVPTPVISQGSPYLAANVTVVGSASVTFSMGSRPDIVLLQPLKA
jgi:hypothetical protein